MTTPAKTLGTLLPLLPLALAMLLMGQSAFADGAKSGVGSQPPGPAPTSNPGDPNYWTPERMKSAKPMPLKPRKGRSAAPSSEPAQEPVPPGDPGARPGYDPNSEPSRMQNRREAVDHLAREEHLRRDAAPLPTGATYPSPHTTFQFPGSYRAYPASPLGRLFFVQNGSNYVCSASLIGYKYVATAGHCVSDGAGHWSTNVTFCPSYNNGVVPELGCWSTNTLVTSYDWLNSADFDMDIGLAIYGTNGSVINDYPGNVVGWFGYAWNWGIINEMMFGYPTADRGPSANNPHYNFDGASLWVTAGEEAGYTVNWGVGYDSKYLGTVQTPGTSGGPWILGWGRRDVDGWSANWINGVNSSQRCYDAACTDTFQEISSPPFFKTGQNGTCGAQGCGVVDIIEWGIAQYP